MARPEECDIDREHARRLSMRMDVCDKCGEKECYVCFGFSFKGDLDISITNKRTFSCPELMYMLNKPRYVCTFVKRRGVMDMRQE